ncbi:MAG: hypothetical protein WCT42_03345 [Candidatus Paceibacterota bacterium]
MKKVYNKFLIVLTIIIFVSGSYLYFSNEESNNIVPVAFGSSLDSSNNTDSASTSAPNDINSDISFLTSLVALKRISIDTSLFTNISFNALQNNGVKIEPVEPGRINPFAPMDIYINNDTSAPLSKIITDQPTQITDKTVTFNGTVNLTSGVTDTYFEYGPTLSLGNLTTIVKQSLVGTFIKNVSGLNPKTNYFYKACAKVNNIALCGEVVSFNTN